MKFEQVLEREAVPEWRPKYVQYRYLKTILSRLPKTPPEEFDPELGTYREHSRDNLPLSETESFFLSRLNQERIKVEDFYNLRENDAFERNKQIVTQIQMLSDNNARSSPCRRGLKTKESVSNLSGDTILSIDTLLKPSLKFKSMRDNSFEQSARSRIKKAFLEFYRSVELLKSFKELNHQAFRKIMKKFDKQTHRNMSPGFMKETEKLSFSISKVPETLLIDLEKIYRRVFTDGNRSKALRELRIPDKQNRTYHTKAGIAGFLLGVMLSIFVSIVKFVCSDGSDQVKTLALLYAGFGLPLLLSWLFTINILVWDRIHINYRFIFEFDHRKLLHSSEISLHVNTFCTIYLGYVYLSITGLLNPFASQLVQLWIIIGLMVLLFINPIPILFFSARGWAMVVFRILMTPYFPVKFPDFFINDQLMSLGFTFQIFGLLIFMTASKELRLPLSIQATWYIATLGCLPAFWRCLQCGRRFFDGGYFFFPHLANMLKYALASSIPLLAYGRDRYAKLFVLLLVIQSICSLFSLAWDICIDFGLLQGNPFDRLLRETLLYRWRFIYYGLILFDLTFRFLWVLPLFPKVHNSLPVLWLACILALAEVLRRFVWNFFRVEYEQVNNCNNLRAYNEVTLPYSARDLFYKDMVEEEIASKADAQDDNINESIQQDIV